MLPKQISGPGWYANIRTFIDGGTPEYLVSIGEDRIGWIEFVDGGWSWYSTNEHLLTHPICMSILQAVKQLPIPDIQ